MGEYLKSIPVYSFVAYLLTVDILGYTRVA
jgi:hypothetical protein